MDGFLYRYFRGVLGQGFVFYGLNIVLVWDDFFLDQFLKFVCKIIRIRSCLLCCQEVDNFGSRKSKKQFLVKFSLVVEDQDWYLNGFLKEWVLLGCIKSSFFFVLYFLLEIEMCYDYKM